MEVFFTLAAIAVIILIVRLVINSNKESQTKKNWDRYEQDYKDNHMEKYVNQYLEANKVTPPSNTFKEWASENITEEEEEEDIEEEPEIDKEQYLDELQQQIEEALLAEARAEVNENPHRDDIMQSQFVIYRLENFKEKFEATLLENTNNRYLLSESEITDLMDESIGNVIRVMFKGLI